MTTRRWIRAISSFRSRNIGRRTATHGRGTARSINTADAAMSPPTSTSWTGELTSMAADADKSRPSVHGDLERPIRAAQEAGGGGQGVRPPARSARREPHRGQRHRAGPDAASGRVLTCRRRLLLLHCPTRLAAPTATRWASAAPRGASSPDEPRGPPGTHPPPRRARPQQDQEKGWDSRIRRATTRAPTQAATLRTTPRGAVTCCSSTTSATAARHSPDCEQPLRR